MEERNHVVYIHINKINLKVYVGQTCQQLHRRWRNGKGYLNCDTYFANAIKKYGWDNFEHIILENGLTKSEADFYEKMYIKEYKSYDKQYGYNLTFGGDGMTPTNETRTKMKLHHPDFKGKKSPRYGIGLKECMTQRNYERWLESHRVYGLKHRGGDNSNAKRVYCYEKDKIYGSLTDAANDCGVSISSISNCINGNVVSAGFDKETGLHLHWCWADDKDTFIPPSQERSTCLGKYHAHVRKIYCFELDEMFYGIGEIQRKYNINTCHLNDCLHGKRHSCGKHPVTGELLHWCYYDEKDTFVIPDIEVSKNLGKNHPRAKAVYCVELDEIFDTAVEAHNKYGFSQQHIGAVCRGQRNTCGKHPETGEPLHWLFKNDAQLQGYIDIINYERRIE